MTPLHSLSTAQLKEALQIREQIESLEARLAQLFGGTPVAVAVPAGRSKGKRVMSAATRAKMAAAQQARWAKKNGLAKVTKAAPVNATSTGKRKPFTAERRAKLAAAMKARWAARKKAGGN